MQGIRCLRRQKLSTRLTGSARFNLPVSKTLMQMKTEPCSGTGVVADDGKNLTPGMRQYREIKAQYPDAILFFHIGDFFETLEGDAEIVSRELDLVLTSRSKNGDR